MIEDHPEASSLGGTVVDHRVLFALGKRKRMVNRMSVEEIRQEIASLSPDEQGELSAFLFHLRHAADRDCQKQVEARLSDRNPTHWLTPEEFERQPVDR